MFYMALINSTVSMLYRALKWPPILITNTFASLLSISLFGNYLTNKFFILCVYIGVILNTSCQVGRILFSSCFCTIKDNLGDNLAKSENILASTFKLHFKLKFSLLLKIHTRLHTCAVVLHALQVIEKKATYQS